MRLAKKEGGLLAALISLASVLFTKAVDLINAGNYEGGLTLVVFGFICIIAIAVLFPRAIKSMTGD